jgi:hypothetical protein
MAYQATGGLLSTASAATAVATDPYLPEVVNLVLKLKASEKKTAGTGSGSTGKGVGLRNVVGPLRAFVKIQENPWILPVGVVGVVGVIFAAGYFTGKTVQKKGRR